VSDVLAALKPLFAPQSVAIVGASKTPGKQGHTALTYLRRGGFSGKIYLINPNEREIEGLPCHRSIAEVPEKVDCALLVIPAAASVAAVAECAKAGVRAAIVGATGYAELGTDDGRARQAEILNAARAAGMRLLGPNTNGIYNASDKFSFGYNRSHGEPLMPGPVSIAAHSGALFNSVSARLREHGIGLAKFVPVGNEADLGMLDFVEYFIADPATRVIGLIVEAIADGERLRALALDAYAAGKQIVALKLGRSRAGAGATEAHSSRLAGSARAYDAFFRAHGIAQVPTIEAMAGACAVLLATRERARDPALVCISTTGGGASLVADFAEARGLRLAGNPDGSWGGGVAAAVARMKNVGIVRNPTDTGAFPSEQHLLGEIFQAQEADGFSGPLMAFAHSLPTVENSQLVADMLIARQARTGSPSVLAAPGGLPESVEAAYRAAGAPYFRDLATAFDSLAAYYATGETPSVEAPAPDTTLAALAGQLSPGAHVLSELDSAAILRAAGVPMVESRRVANEPDACREAAALGYPVVLKALAPGVAHKNKLGLVAAGIADEAALKQAFAQLGDRLRAQAIIGATLIVQPMLAAKAELIVGVTTEAPFGHFLVAGLGGIYTELLDDVVLLPVAVDRAAIRARLLEATAGKLAQQAGGTAALEQTVNALVSLQRLVRALPARIRSIDVNPLLITGAGAVAVDALVVTG